MHICHLSSYFCWNLFNTFHLKILWTLLSFSSLSLYQCDTKVVYLAWCVYREGRNEVAHHVVINHRVHKVQVPDLQIIVALVPLSINLKYGPNLCSSPNKTMLLVWSLIKDMLFRLFFWFHNTIFLQFWSSFVYY